MKCQENRYKDPAVLLVVPTKNAQYWGVNDKEALERIGQLIRDARKHLGESMASLADKAGINSKTLWSAETGARFPHDVNQLKIERALGWRDGSIAEAFRDRENLAPENLTLEWMQAGGDSASWGELAKESNGPLQKAGKLSDEELLTELMYRFRNYREENSRLREQLGT
jgi:transcriptional regulator with XRE-family HTH domain